MSRFRGRLLTVLRRGLIVEFNAPDRFESNCVDCRGRLRKPGHFLHEARDVLNLGGLRESERLAEPGDFFLGEFAGFLEANALGETRRFADTGGFGASSRFALRRGDGPFEARDVRDASGFRCC